MQITKTIYVLWNLQDPQAIIYIHFLLTTIFFNFQITFTMSLFADIQKVTQIPQTDENVVFVRRKESNTFKRNPKLKKIKPPQNANVSNYIVPIYPN